MQPSALFYTWISGWYGISLFTTLLCVLAIGIVDDIRSLTPLEKVGGQLILALIAYFSGFGISIGNTMGILDLPFTLIWIIGVTNALNLIDGLDGLASGVAIIASATIALISCLHGDTATSIISVMLIGSLIGFLKYNFNPAKIFLGDSGSLFLGFLLSILSLKSYTKTQTGFAILIPVLILGLPIMDTFLSMIRRVLNSFLPENAGKRKISDILKSMFRPDRGHIHHKLIFLGLSTRNAVISLYIFSAVMGLGALVITVVSTQVALVSLLIVGLFIASIIKRLQYREFSKVSYAKPKKKVYSKYYINLLGQIRKRPDISEAITV
jgi:UDP-GlcNAc:undecaprenyl-phosphate GlcNAc-1-phosphate transferase